MNVQDPSFYDLSIDDLKMRIADVPDFPKPGILFKDITPILQDPKAFRSCIDQIAKRIKSFDFDHIAAIESRGFLLGSALAEKLHKGIVLIRKPGKLPRKTISHTYDLEYGSDTLEIHAEDLGANDRVLIVDDVLATGGTALAAETLCKNLGATVVGHLFLIKLAFLNGEQKLTAPVESLFDF